MRCTNADGGGLLSSVLSPGTESIEEALAQVSRRVAWRWLACARQPPLGGSKAHHFNVPGEAGILSPVWQLQLLVC